MKILHNFVDTIPEKIKSGEIYISVKYNTAIHKCPCGCGEEVVTPISPTDWKLIYNGQTISLEPSIGNWAFACKSHYWIKDNSIIWSGHMSDYQIKNIRDYDKEIKINSFKKNHNVLTKFFERFLLKR